jgi:primosomal protein N' (replication factor Y)
VLVQSYRVDATAIACARKHDYAEFYRGELAARQELGYPPFGYLVALRVDGKEAAEVEKHARELARAAERLGAAQAGVAVLGPCEAPLARLKGRTRWHIWLRAGERRPLRRLLRALCAQEQVIRSGVRVSVDVDPISAL